MSAPTPALPRRAGEGASAPTPALPRRAGEGGKKAVWWGILAGIAFLFVWLIPYFPSLNNPNENSRVYQIRAAVELHKLSINEQIDRYGWVNDLAVKDGKYYAGKAPGTTFIGIPIYAALRAWEKLRGHGEVQPFRLLFALRLFGTILPTLLFIAVFRRFIRRVVDDDVIANALTIAMALGSMLMPYALLFVNHSLTAATAFGAVIATIAAVRERDRVGREGRVPMRSWLWLGVAGALLSATSALDYALAPVSLMLLVWVPIRFGVSWASTAGAWLGASIPALWTGVYHTICWGGPFQLSINRLANTQFQANQSKGMFGIVGPSAAALWGNLLGPNKGIFYLTPLFALAMIASVAAVVRSRSRRDAILCLLVVWWMLLYACSLTNWDAGWTVGPRYASVMVPFAFYSLALAWEKLGTWARRIALPLGAGLAVIGVLSTSLTSAMFPHLPPEYGNPVYEIIWPLWRDGFAPMSLGTVWFGWTGRLVQVPFAIVIALLLLYLVRAGGRKIGPRWWAGMIGSAAVCAIVLIGLRVGTIARTTQPGLIDAATRWIRTQVWYPPLPKRADARALHVTVADASER